MVTKSARRKRIVAPFMVLGKLHSLRKRRRRGASIAKHSENGIQLFERAKLLNALTAGKVGSAAHPRPTCVEGFRVSPPSQGAEQWRVCLRDAGAKHNCSLMPAVCCQ